MEDFVTQGITNDLHIISNQRHKIYKVTGDLLLTLERRTETISGEFKSENMYSDIREVQLQVTICHNHVVG